MYYISDEAWYCKKTNAFGISRGSVSFMIRKVSKAIGEFLAEDYMKLPETADEVENLTQKFFRTPQIPAPLFERGK